LAEFACKIENSLKIQIIDVSGSSKFASPQIFSYFIFFYFSMNFILLISFFFFISFFLFYPGFYLPIYVFSFNFFLFEPVCESSKFFLAEFACKIENSLKIQVILGE
jgi:hypothetical protein